jgi:hypothetical protein
MGIISDLYAFPPERIAQSDALTGQLIMAHRRLAELKGVAPLLPNQELLLNTLALQEAKDSAAIIMLTYPYSSSYKGIKPIDHVQYLAIFEHDKLLM